MSTLDEAPGGGGGTARSAAPAPRAGRTGLGMVGIDDRVVAKLAARAALEIPDAGGAAPRILGKSLGGLRGARDTSLDSLPKAAADVDGSVAVLELQISVRWPASVPDVAAAVRQHVAGRVQSLTGLHVAEVAIAVTDLVTHLDPPPRVGQPERTPS